MALINADKNPANFFKRFFEISLYKQMWLAIIVLMLLTFMTSFFVNLSANKFYLNQQLQSKNIDNATSLALSMSQMDKDIVMLELMIAAQFDAGHYQLIRLVGDDKQVLAERANPRAKPDVPKWFLALVDLKINPGVAFVQDAWKPFGSIILETDVSLAYESLWDNSKKLLIVSLLMGLLSGVIGSLILTFLLRPLKTSINLAEAIGERRFITAPVPKTLEFKQLVMSMNRLSERTKVMLLTESAQLEKLRLQATKDIVSDLLNRDTFIKHVETKIEDEDSFETGVLVVVRLNYLNNIDQRLGHEKTDGLIKRLGDALNVLCSDHQRLLAGRLSGSDFAVFSSDSVDCYIFAHLVNNYLSQELEKLVDTNELSIDLISLTAIANQIGQQQSLQAVLAHTEQMLLQANKLPSVEVYLKSVDEQSSANTYDEDTWHTLLSQSISNKKLKLAAFPVVDFSGKLLHFASPARLKFDNSDRWLTAGEFITRVERLNLIEPLDLLVVDVALNNIISEGKSLSIHIAARNMQKTEFVESLLALIKRHKEVAHLLNIEVVEQAVYQQPQAFRLFCEKLKKLGCKIGIKDMGRHVSMLSELQDLGLDYIKISASLTKEIDQNKENQVFLIKFCMLASALGITTLAENVQTEREITTLQHCGFQGFTGSLAKISI